MSRRFFIPLKREYFEAFESGTKTQEYRPASSHFGKAKAGDTVLLSLGYGTRRRLTGVIRSVARTRCLDGLRGWRECYGHKHDEAVVINIVLDAKGGAS